MNKILVAIDTVFLIARPWVHYCLMRQHRTALIRDVNDISMAFQALIIFNGCISHLPVLVMVIIRPQKMYEYVFYAVDCFSVKKVHRIVRRGQMAIHTICHKPLRIIDVSGGFPRIVGKLYFVAGCTKSRCARAHHCIIGHAENRKGDENTDTYK